jgi:hypothetical protein
MCLAPVGALIDWPAIGWVRGIRYQAFRSSGDVFFNVLAYDIP